MFKIVIILIVFGSKVNNEQCSEDNIHDSRIHNANNVTHDLPSLYMTQTTILTNYCMCTCCHRTDIPKSQCIIFKASKYKLGKILLFKKHYQTDTLFLQPRNTFARNVTNICYYKKMPINSIAIKNEINI